MMIVVKTEVRDVFRTRWQSGAGTGGASGIGRASVIAGRPGAAVACSHEETGAKLGCLRKVKESAARRQAVLTDLADTSRIQTRTQVLQESDESTF